MKKASISIVAIATILLISCGDTKEAVNEKEVVETIEEPKEKVCTYNFDGESVKLNWTAFKLTDKIGVGGTFDSIFVEGFNQGATTIYEAISNINFELYTNSTNTANEGRDTKIKESFFGVMEDPDVITGYIESIVPTSEDMKAGEGIYKIFMNGEYARGPINWKLEGDLFSLETTININEWKGEAALESLNKVCEEKHTGEDGVSKLWPDVDVEVLVELTKTCK